MKDILSGGPLIVLVVGSGGREHALAWKVAQSPRLAGLYIAPGNAGTARLGKNIPLPAEGEGASQALVDIALQNAVDLVLIGPEGPLSAGLADELQAAGVHVFGPSRLAARIEASKSFAKAFMARHAIPTARFMTFTEYGSAVQYLRQVDWPVVIKASGLAAGKGVFVPDNLAEAESALRAMLVEREFGEAGQEVIVEERLPGEEVSLLAFTDGNTVRPMPPAQDHKRLLDGDLGPNTGGMGAYAPAPALPAELVEEVARKVLLPAVEGLRAEGCPFVGVLYAGLMLTPGGPKVLEFNCRFGDPEAEAILPLLDTDLLDIAAACVLGRLHEVENRWKAGAAACVVLASENYPGPVPKGREIFGLDAKFENALIFHAGTRRDGERVVTSGGRVLGVTGWGESGAEALSTALRTAYGLVDQIQFEGMQYRKDIGARAIHISNPNAAAIPSTPDISSYARAGVDIDAGNRAVELMRAAVRATYGPQVLSGIGAFGGLFDASALKDMRQPVLVASTDGVGTKVKLAAQAGRYTSIGHDLVNHCVNDILVQGARPLFFLDYIASSRLDPLAVVEIVRGIAAACQGAGCALLGGETAEMPGVYAPGEFDVAGTILGVVERDEMFPRPGICAGDVLLGLRSSGPHTNGYSLIRKVFEGIPLEAVFPELGRPLSEALLAPHRSYLSFLHPILTTNAHRAAVKALAHITGGGFVENIPRVLPTGLGAVIRRGSWPVPPLFTLIQQRGGVSAQEMHRVFNMGIGMVLITSPHDARLIQGALDEETWIIGEVIQGGPELRLT